MSFFKKINLEIDHKYDNQRKRHYLNGHLCVFHCHHYSCLYTQLALDANETQLLSDVSEDTFYKVLHDYFTEKGISDIAEKIELSCQYYAAFGLGKMAVNFLGDESGEVELAHSHVDEGWIKKWGKYDKPVNYISCGFVNALFSVVNDRPIGTYNTVETESIVMGAKKSTLRIVKK